MIKKEEISDVVFLCLRDMINARTNVFQGQWKDYGNETGTVIKLEALMCFLLALDTIPEIREKIFKIFPEENIRNECIDILKDEKTFLFNGDPYIKVLDIENNEHGFLDAASFTISLIFFYNKLWDTQSENINILQNAFYNALSFLKNSYIQGKGWSFTNYDLPQEPFIYCTWMALDTLSDFYELTDISIKPFINKDSFEILSFFKNEKTKILSYLEDMYIDNDTDAQFNKSIKLGRIKFSSDDEAIHYNLWNIMSMLFLESKRGYDLNLALELVKTEHKDSERAYDSVTKSSWEIYFETDDKIKRNPKKKGQNLNSFKDRAFLPQYLKAIILFLREHPKFSDNTKLDIEDAYLNLLENRGLNSEDENQRVNYWDLYAEKKGYAIYYTERAIEALCHLYKYIEIQQTTLNKNFLDVQNIKVTLAEESLLKLAEIIDKKNIIINCDSLNIETIIDEKVKDAINNLPVFEDIKQNFSSLENFIKQLEQNIISDSKMKRKVDALKGDLVEALKEDKKK